MCKDAPARQPSPFALAQLLLSHLVAFSFLLLPSGSPPCWHPGSCWALDILCVFPTHLACLFSQCVGSVTSAV